MRYSANTGFLWTDRPFLDRIAAAAAAGFDAVEFHDEVQRHDADAVRAAVTAAGLPVMGLNVDMAETQGCAAIPGEEARAEADFRAALAAAEAVGAGAVHVLSGRTDDGRADEVLAANLARFAALTDRTLLIEPLCRAAAPGYALRDVDQAARVLDRAGPANARILFDAYHVAQEGHDFVAAWRAHRDRVGHVQIAHPETRAEPDESLRPFLDALRADGWDAPVGAEYKPAGAVEDGLGWRDRLGS